MSEETIQFIAARQGEVVTVKRKLPPLTSRRIRVRTFFSAVSAGTELLTLQQSRRDEQLHPLGYQLSGVVEEVSADLSESYHPGDMVACYGAPYVAHAAIVDVPPHLLTPVPPILPMEEASFCGLGAIALHAFRCSELKIGEAAVIIGLGVLGNIIAQLCNSAGCRTAGVDLASSRCDTAEACGIRTYGDFESLREDLYHGSNGHGCDAVFLAAGNCSDEMIAAAFGVLRREGAVLLVGTSSASLPREALFAKEARLLVPRAAGPGRYDTQYEGEAVDYPYPYVRWTEHRNLEEFVRQLAVGRARITPLISRMEHISTASEVYRRLQQNNPPLGTVFQWQA